MDALIGVLESYSGLNLIDGNVGLFELICFRRTRSYFERHQRRHPVKNPRRRAVVSLQVSHRDVFKLEFRCLLLQLANRLHRCQRLGKALAMLLSLENGQILAFRLVDTDAAALVVTLH